MSVENDPLRTGTGRIRSPASARPGWPSFASLSFRRTFAARRGRSCRIHALPRAISRQGPARVSLRQPGVCGRSRFAGKNELVPRVPELAVLPSLRRMPRVSQAGSGSGFSRPTRRTHAVRACTQSPAAALRRFRRLLDASFRSRPGLSPSAARRRSGACVWGLPRSFQSTRRANPNRARRRPGRRGPGPPQRLNPGVGARKSGAFSGASGVWHRTP